MYLHQGIAILVLAISATGCTYLKDRGADFLDCFKFYGTPGAPFFEVRIDATKVFATGLGFTYLNMDCRVYGLVGRQRIAPSNGTSGGLRIHWRLG